MNNIVYSLPMKRQLLTPDIVRAETVCVKSQYTEELIASVEYVLHYRNKDIAPLENDGSDGERVLTSNLAAEGKDHADVPSRRAFEALLELLPLFSGKNIAPALNRDDDSFGLSSKLEMEIKTDDFKQALSHSFGIFSIISP